MKRVFLYLLLIVLLGCRNEEMLIEQVSNSEKGKIEFFENYENNKIVNYPYSWLNYKVITPNTPFHQSFKILLHNVPNLKNHIENNYGRIEWDITTEVIENEIGDKFVYYPIVNKEDKVDFMAKVVVSKDNDAFGLEIQNRKSEETRRLFDKTDELNVGKLQVLRRCNVNGICYLPGVEIIKPRPIVPRYPRFSVDPYNPPHYDIGDGGGLFVPIECMSVRGCGDGNILPQIEEAIQENRCKNNKKIASNSIVNAKNNDLKEKLKDIKKNEVKEKDIFEDGYTFDRYSNGDINPNVRENRQEGQSRMVVSIKSNTVGYNHTHPRGVKMFSPADIDSFVSIVRNAKRNNIPYNELFATVVFERDNRHYVYQMTYTGDGNDLPAEFTKEQLKKYTDMYREEAKEYIEYGNGEMLVDNGYRLFLNTLKNMGIKNVQLSDVSNPQKPIVIEDNKGRPKKVNCK